ncbi:MAG: transposase [Steroidobacteraceae bacterium]
MTSSRTSPCLAVPRAAARDHERRQPTSCAARSSGVQNVVRSKVEPMKAVAVMIHRTSRVLAWGRNTANERLLEAINGLFQAAERKARGYGTFRTIRMVIFLVAGKLDFSRLEILRRVTHSKFSDLVTMPVLHAGFVWLLLRRALRRFPSRRVR